MTRIRSFEFSSLNQDIVKDANHNRSFSFFNKLPKDILENELLPYLDLNSDDSTVNALANVPSHASLLLKAHQLLKPLLEAVIHGEKNNVEKILSAHPSLHEKLLTTPMKVTDYSGRVIYGTALQLALGAEDFSRKRSSDEGMVETIIKFLDKLPNGKLIKNAQIKQQFPKGWELEEVKRKAEDSAALHKVFNAIIYANPPSYCEKALAEFREYLKPKTLIKSGKHFNADLFVEACQLYKEAYGRWGGEYSFGNILYWNKVIGYLQRYLPACYAQAFCQIALDISGKDLPLKRSLSFQDYSVHEFFPLSPTSRLGYDYAVLGKTFRNASWMEAYGFECRIRQLRVVKTNVLEHLIKAAYEEEPAKRHRTGMTDSRIKQI